MLDFNIGDICYPTDFNESGSRGLRVTPGTGVHNWCLSLLTLVRCPPAPAEGPESANREPTAGLSRDNESLKGKFVFQ